ncbi:hypothetical protein RB200_20525 [Streptomyces sp. PmtG]
MSSCSTCPVTSYSCRTRTSCAVAPARAPGAHLVEPSLVDEQPDGDGHDRAPGGEERRDLPAQAERVEGGEDAPGRPRERAPGTGAGAAAGRGLHG